ncbi:DUF4296 domain-containing protein [Leptobacterium sp. I13]|uniref:DUF4296 domain-containing protein n=1 Tax=Leptobacterium meishanense TaxID=3128904 RepID=UPI0030EC0471
MKNLVYSLLCITVIISCKEEVVEKPEDLISEDKMVEIIYDLAIFNAAKGISIAKLEEGNVKLETFIYERYHIDSTRFANSSIYYASEPEIHLGIYKKVEERLNKYNDVLKKAEEERRKLKDSTQKIVRDSIKLIKN